MSTPSSYDPLPGASLKRLEALEVLPELTRDDTYGAIRTVLIHFFPIPRPHCWIIKIRGAIYQAATPETKNTFKDEYNRDVDYSVKSYTAEFIVAKYAGTMDTVNPEGTESPAPGVGHRENPDPGIGQSIRPGLGFLNPYPTRGSDFFRGSDTC